ncbi:MAG: M6 family metalloprotease domain-containing protein [Eubacteriaceae bacterium]|nr:M6 family metalloprotease domain-containing protein [Eubacteriaceae bacterium]
MNNDRMKAWKIRGTGKKSLVLTGLLLVVVLFALSGSVWAMPARENETTYTQPDGVTFSAKAVGDEYFQGNTKADGSLIVKTGDGLWHYVVSDGTTLALGDRADASAPANAATTSSVETDEGKAQYYALAGRTYNSDCLKQSGTSDPVSVQALESKQDSGILRTQSLDTKTGLPTIGIVVSFQDMAAMDSDNWAGSYFTGEDSLENYYKGESNNQFTFYPVEESSAKGVDGNTNQYDAVNDGIVYVTLNRNHGNWKGNYGDETVAEDMISMFRDAFAASAKYVDYQQYDTNNDGTLTNDELALTFVVAGYESSYGGDNAHSIWAHSWDFEDQFEPFSADGITMHQYICFGEQWKDNADSSYYPQAGLGSLTHELGHYLGLSDLYDVNYSKEGEWINCNVKYLSLMCGGSWGNYKDAGGNLVFKPAALDPYCRSLLGYIDPEVLDQSGTYTVSSRDDSGGYTAYRINTSDPDQYYLVENRQYAGRDLGLQGCYQSRVKPYVVNNPTGGVVIWHIDNKICEECDIYATGSKQNTINVATHRPGVMPVFRTGEQSIDSSLNVLYYYPFYNKALLETFPNDTVTTLANYNGDKIADMVDTGESVNATIDAASSAMKVEVTLKANPISQDQISVANNTITVKETEDNQEYALFDAEGNLVSGWTAAGDGQVVFDKLTYETTYTVKTRYTGDDKSVSDGTEVTTGKLTPVVSYSVHGQNYGWTQGYKSDGITAGTTGKGLRLEAIKATVTDNNGKAIDGLGIRYNTHLAGNGWQGWKENGTLAGTTGQARQIEALRMQLTGDKAGDYDIYYRVHAENFGWMNWAKNGEEATFAGTTGFGFRVEAVQVMVVPAGLNAPAANPANDTDEAGCTAENIHFEGHVQNIGWQGMQQSNQATIGTAGTTGEGLRVEAIKLYDDNAKINLSYRAHVQNVGWQSWMSEGQTAGTTGEGLRVEAFELKATGEDADKYVISYRAHVQNLGWTDWMTDGKTAGTTGLGLRLEAIQIKVEEANPL